MPFASGSGVRVAYVPETAFGVTPATPAFKPLQVTTGGLRTNKATGTSEERRPDRNVRDEFELGQDVTGSFSFEAAYGPLDDIFSAALFAQWNTNVLKNGTTPQSFTFEETIPVGTDEFYSRFPGAMINTLSLNIAAREAVTGQFTVMAEKEVTSDEPVEDSTYAAASTAPTMTASANVASFAVTGVVGTPLVRSISLEINNNLRTRPAVGTKFSAEFGAGRCDVTGSMAIYFASNALYDQVLAHGSAAVSWIMGNATNQKYRVTLPKIRLGDGERTVGGTNDDVMLTVPFRAIFDATENCSIKIERAVA